MSKILTLTKKVRRLRISNAGTVGVGVLVTLICIWKFRSIIGTFNPMIYGAGIVSIISWMLIAGKIEIPVEHFGVLKFFGRRIRFVILKEGLGWALKGVFSVVLVSGKERFYDIPGQEVNTKGDEDPVFVNVFIRAKTINPIDYLDLESQAIDEVLMAAILERIWTFIGEKSREEQLSDIVVRKKELEDAVKEIANVKKPLFGNIITEVEIRDFRTPDSVQKAKEENEARVTKVKTLSENVDRYREGREKEVSEAEAREAVFIAGGDIEKKIIEETKSQKVAIESSTIEVIAKVLSAVLATRRKND